MPTSSGLDTLCAHCGRPIVHGPSVRGSGGTYHEECTHGPGWNQPVFQPASTGFNKAAMDVLADVYGVLWCEASYDPTNEQLRQFAAPLAEKMGKANDILKFKP